MKNLYHRLIIPRCVITPAAYGIFVLPCNAAPSHVKRGQVEVTRQNIFYFRCRVCVKQYTAERASERERERERER